MAAWDRSETLMQLLCEIALFIYKARDRKGLFSRKFPEDHCVCFTEDELITMKLQLVRMIVCPLDQLKFTVMLIFQ